MRQTPFLLKPSALDIPQPPKPRATSGEPVNCGSVCTQISNWQSFSNADIDGFKGYFDKYYTSSGLDDDQKVLYGLYMKLTGAAPFDLNASAFVNAGINLHAPALMLKHGPIYAAIGRFMDISRYWDHVLSQLGVKKGAATTSEVHTISTGTSTTTSNSDSVINSWQVETHQTLGGSIGLDIPFLNLGVAGEMSRAETNSGSTTRTTSSQVGMTEAASVQHTFTFNGPQPGEPDPIDLTWWQLNQVIRLGDVVWLGSAPFDVTQPPPHDGMEITFPRGGQSGGGWCELVQKFDTFQLVRG